MIRVVVFLIFVGVVALGAGWLADRPGGVEIVWLSYRITTSVAVLAAAVVLIVAAFMVLWSVASALIRSPGKVSHYFALRRITQGQRAITRGLIAIGAGDVRGAAKFSGEAKRLAHDNPLTLLLTAQSAQLSGDRAAAEKVFEQMMARPDLKAIGLHGMFVEARRHNDPVAARVLAEEAAKAAPSLGWAGQAVLEFRCAAGDWSGAIEALDRNKANGLIDKVMHRRLRAVLLTAQAQNVAPHDRDAARALVLEAVKLAPDLVPAAAMAGRFHADANDTRKASRVLDTAWKANPHLDIAEAYINLKPGDSVRDKLARAQKLVKSQPGNVEGALALARAAIDAQAFDVARNALAPQIAAPTQRVALLMAELEEAEHNDVGRARAWTARAVHAAHDPAWTADGYVSENWMPVSPATGRLDAFEWRVPIAELPGTARPEIEAEPLIDAVPQSAPVMPEIVTMAPEPVAPKVETPKAPKPEVKSAPRARRVEPAAVVPAETIIPLVHAPDDPGPDAADDAAPLAGPKPDNGRKLRDLFK
jgi:HemY protein